MFHSHRLTDSDKYIQPDAANFNSWRRHTKLLGDPPEVIKLLSLTLKAHPCPFIHTLTLLYKQRFISNTYRKVASSDTSRLEAHAGFFRLLMKGIFDPSVL